MKKTFLSIIIISILFTTGCWDMIEINERTYPYSVGIDLSDNEEDRFNITFSYPNIYAIGKNASQEKRVHVITTTGNDIFSGIHHLTSRLQYPIFNKHLRVIVLQEDVAQNKKFVKEIVDGINRDFIINKTIQMVVVKDSAKDLLNAVPTSERQEVVGGTLFTMLANQQQSTQFTPKKLAEFIEDMDVKSASVVPLAYPKDGEILFSGGAIFKDFTHIGYIDHEENQAIAILNQVVKEDGFHALYNDINISILATGFKVKKRLEDSENLKIVYHVQLDGQIHEYTLADGTRIDNQEIIKGLEEALASDLEDNLNKTIQKLQKEFKADVIKVGDYLRKYHNKLWVQVEDNWDEVFSEADISAEVVIKIRRRGLTK